jgi:hypothetical protein
MISSKFMVRLFEGPREPIRVAGARKAIADGKALA